MSESRTNRQEHDATPGSQLPSAGEAELETAGPTPTLARSLANVDRPSPGSPDSGAGRRRPGGRGISGDLLALQRLAGNRATSRFLAGERSLVLDHREDLGPDPGAVGGPTAASDRESASGGRDQVPMISRLATTAKSLGDTGIVGQVKALFGQSTYVKIKEAVTRYHEAKDPQARRRALQEISPLILQWMSANGWGKSSGNQSRKAKLMALDHEVHEELASTDAATSAAGTSDRLADVADALPETGTAPESTTEEAKDANPETAPVPIPGQHEHQSGPPTSAAPRPRPQLSPQQSMVKTRAILSLQGQLHELKTAADSTPKVAAKVEAMKKASALLARLVPMLNEPHMASVQKATADYQRALLEALPALEKQAQYMGDLEAGQGKFAYLSLAGVQAISDAMTLAQGTTRSVDPEGRVAAPGMGAEALRIMQETGMTDAEMAAIKIYTAPDYRYINAGMAKNRGGWLTSAIRQDESGARVGDNRILGDADLEEGFSGPRSPADMAAAEGRRHGTHAVEGMKKMPPWKGQTFRGAGFTHDQFQEQFGRGVWSADSFTSTSTQQAVSEGFAHNESVGGKIGVLMVFKVTNGRDIKDLSIYSGEGEVLLMPGTRATVTNIETHPGPPEIKIVHLEQTT